REQLIHLLGLDVKLVDQDHRADLLAQLLLQRDHLVHLDQFDPERGVLIVHVLFLLTACKIASSQRTRCVHASLTYGSWSYMRYSFKYFRLWTILSRHYSGNVPH